jgi:trans-aconitate methyltransferase
MNNVKFVENLAQKYDPLLPIDQLVIEMNRVFHGIEASTYDAIHPEISEQLPAIWKEMSKQVTEYFGLKKLHILDFGCGTGFAAQQMLQNIPGRSIAGLTCYDPSPEMLEKCRAKIVSLYPDAAFSSSLEEVLTSNEPYSLLLSNSVLHHLPDVLPTIGILLPLLDANALWLAGHEPSLRFYNNSECVANLQAYLQERRPTPSAYSRLLKRLIRREGNLYTKIAQEAVRVGLFKRQPSALVIDRIVDFHVAHSTEEISIGRGFDFTILQQDFRESWKLTWLKTYGFMGPIFEGELKDQWAASSKELARRFPHDGANFCTIWQRI